MKELDAWVDFENVQPSLDALADGVSHAAEPPKAVQKYSILNGLKSSFRQVF